MDVMDQHARSLHFISLMSVRARVPSGLNRLRQRLHALTNLLRFRRTTTVDARTEHLLELIRMPTKSQRTKRLAVRAKNNLRVVAIAIAAQENGGRSGQDVVPRCWRPRHHVHVHRARRVVGERLELLLVRKPRRNSARPCLLLFVPVLLVLVLAISMLLLLLPLLLFCPLLLLHSARDAFRRLRR